MTPTAVHEAGHAGVMLAGGWGRYIVGIEVTGAVGRVRVRGTPPAELGAVTVYAAGPVAEGFHLGRHVPLAGADLDTALAIARQLDWRNPWAVVARAEAEARVLLRDPVVWSAVRRIAARLAVSGFMTGAECRTVYEDSFRRP